MVTVRLEDSGPRAGVAVIILHGWGSSSAQMESISKRMSRHYRTVSIDFPGHGFSPEPPTAWGVPEHVELVEAVISHLCLSSYILVGHSNGGRVALELASYGTSMHKPEFLALISPSGIKGSRTISYHVRFWVARLLKAPFNIMPQPVRRFGLDWLRHSLLWRLLGSSDYRALGGVMRETFVKTLNHYVTAKLKRVTCPVIVFWGSEDDAISRSQMDELICLLPDAGLFVLEGAGHYAHNDQPESVVKGIMNMLDGIAN